jgi:hypothetical protein
LNDARSANDNRMTAKQMTTVWKWVNFKLITSALQTSCICNLITGEKIILKIMIIFLNFIERI